MRELRRKETQNTLVSQFIRLFEVTSKVRFRSWMPLIQNSMLKRSDVAARTYAQYSEVRALNLKAFVIWQWHELISIGP